MTKIYHANSTQKKAGVIISIWGKGDFRAKKLPETERELYNDKGSIHQEDTAILNVYEPKTKASKCLKPNW